jgi:hypothetical protein
MMSRLTRNRGEGDSMSQSTLAREASRTDRTPASSSLELTILMPCLNEAETIEVCVRKRAASSNAAG